MSIPDRNNRVNYDEARHLPINSPERFQEMPQEDQETLLRWIRGNVEPARHVGRGTSYGWKHILQHDTGLYVANGQFKGAMIEAGFEPVDRRELNWRFKAKVRDYDTRGRCA
jgi:hypothetical protein